MFMQKNAFYGQSHSASASNMLLGSNSNSANNNNLYHSNYQINMLAKPFNGVSNHNQPLSNTNNNQFTNNNNNLNHHHQNKNPFAINNNAHHQLLPSVDKIIKEKHGAETWGYQVLPSLYSVYQKVVDKLMDFIDFYVRSIFGLEAYRRDFWGLIRFLYDFGGMLVNWT